MKIVESVVNTLYFNYYLFNTLFFEYGCFHLYYCLNLFYLWNNFIHSSYFDFSKNHYFNLQFKYIVLKTELLYLCRYTIFRFLIQLLEKCEVLLLQKN